MKFKIFYNYSIMSDRVIITSWEKVALVVPEKQDIDMWYKWINNPEINKYLIFWNTIWSREAEEGFYDSLNKEGWNKAFCIMSLNTGDVIWNIEFHNIDNLHGRADLWIAIFKQEEHSKWFGTEAIKLILDYWFKVQNYRKVKLEYYWWNKAWEIVYNRIWFKEIGRNKEDYYTQGKYEDRVMMEIFKDEFYDKNPEFLK